MKKYLIIGILLTGYCVANSQIIDILRYDTILHKVIYTDVVNMDSSHTADVLYNSCKEWFSSNITKFNRSSSEKNSSLNDDLFGTQKKDMATIDLSYKNNQPLKMDDPSQKKLIGTCVLKYFGSSMGCVRVVYLTFDIIILIKDRKYKYEITNFEYSHYNPYKAAKIGFNLTNDKGPCKSTGPIEDLLNCKNCTDRLNEFYSYIDKEIKFMINNLNEFTKSSRTNTTW
jgi:hypothetical protein